MNNYGASGGTITRGDGTVVEEISAAEAMERSRAREREQEARGRRRGFLSARVVAPKGAPLAFASRDGEAAGYIDGKRRTKKR
jgi:hypothetical protein